jgi:hypothetical protein
MEEFIITGEISNTGDIVNRYITIPAVLIVFASLSLLGYLCYWACCLC